MGRMSAVRYSRTDLSDVVDLQPVSDMSRRCFCRISSAQRPPSAGTLSLTPRQRVECAARAPDSLTDAHTVLRFRGRLVTIINPSRPWIWIYQFLDNHTRSTTFQPPVAREPTEGQVVEDLNDPTYACSQF